MESSQRTIEFYRTGKARQPFTEWLYGLKDFKGQSRIEIKLDRLRLGNFSGCASLGGGVHELKVDFGPGYRVYFGDVDNVVVLLLCGGDKSTQAKDIDLAKKYWADYKKRDR